jgi:hypothetical protein
MDPPKRLSTTKCPYRDPQSYALPMFGLSFAPPPAIWLSLAETAGMARFVR